MTWFSGTVIFIISWWMVFLAALPIGVRGQHEDGAPQDGTEPGAPVHHLLPKKVLWATFGAAAVTFIAFLIGLSGLIRYPEVPWA